MTSEQELEDEMFDTLAVSLEADHWRSLRCLNDPECGFEEYWAGHLWAIERAQRVLGLEWEQ
jgi:hypothetical protein